MVFYFCEHYTHMAEPLKNIYNDHFFNEFNLVAEKAIAQWDAKQFKAMVKTKEWPRMELKQRMRHLSSCLHKALPVAYPEQLAAILKIVTVIEKGSGLQYSGLAYMFIPDFVEQYGLIDYNRSFKAMEKINMITSCEFAIRPFLLASQDKTMKQMVAWSKHPHQNIRRFSSEGCRPRLPWALGIPSLKKDPSPILPILENLKADPSVFVQKSVANNLNDISKDHPEMVLTIAKKWKGKSPITDWILKHGCRGLLKNGSDDALHLFGTRSDVKTVITDFRLDKNKIVIGDRFHFAFNLELMEKSSTALRIEYVIYFKKAFKGHSRKIFKINERNYTPGTLHHFSKYHSFKDLTTRKHLPGAHAIAIIINGKEMARQDFDLLVS